MGIVVILVIWLVICIVIKQLNTVVCIGVTPCSHGYDNSLWMSGNFLANRLLSICCVGWYMVHGVNATSMVMVAPCQNPSSFKVVLLLIWYAVVLSWSFAHKLLSQSFSNRVWFYLCIQWITGELPRLLYVLLYVEYLIQWSNPNMCLNWVLFIVNEGTVLGQSYRQVYDYLYESYFSHFIESYLTKHRHY